MGLALMTHDLNDIYRVLGRLEVGVEEGKQQNLDLKNHLRRQDEVALIRDQQTEANKRAAIERGEREKREIQEHLDGLHQENKAEFKEVKEKATMTYGMAAASAIWIAEHGKPLIDKVNEIDERLDAIKGATDIADAETRGKKIAYGTVGTVFGAITAALLPVVAPEFLAAVKRFFHL